MQLITAVLPALACSSGWCKAYMMPCPGRVFAQVAETLAKQVLTAPGDEVQVLATSQVGFECACTDGPTANLITKKRQTAVVDCTLADMCGVDCGGLQRTDEKGRNYFELEFTAKAARFTRHQLAVVAVANGGWSCVHAGMLVPCLTSLA